MSTEMPRHRPNQQQGSAPPSPICSDTVSLPDANSDLENLSDYSGLSISDEDDKHSRSNTESDVEQFSDGDFDEITHSMLAPSDLRSSAPARVKDQSTSTSTSDSVDPEKTPSASFNRQRPSPLFNKRISASDLAYPTLSQSTDTDNIFGLNLNSIYQQFEEERTISQDQDLIGYSILDTQGESFRHKYERSVQTELSDSIINDSADTLSGLARSASVDSVGDDTDSPFVSGGWPKEADIRPTREQTADKQLVSREKKEEEEGDEASLLANWQRCGPRWLNKQTFSIFGVVLLGVAAYHVKSAPWFSIDTNGLFLNTTSVIVSDTSTTIIVTTTDLPLHKGAATTVPPVDMAQVAAIPSSTAQATSTNSVTSKVERSDSDLPSTYNKAALASIPSSVSALISLASSGIASLSTHVVSGSKIGGCSRDSQFQTIVASRQHGHRCARKTAGNVQTTRLPDDARPAGYLPYGAAALSGLPRKAQRGLSTLTQRSSPASGVRHNRGSHHKWEKKKQVSRRTGKHWIYPLPEEVPSVPYKPSAEVIGNMASSTQASQHLSSDKAVRAPFSRLGGHNFWNVVPYLQAGGAKARDAVTLSEGRRAVADEEQQLFLDSAGALSRLSFGSLFKQLDDLLLPFAQHIVDSLNTLDWVTVLDWIRTTSNECYGIMAPYMASVDAYAKKHVTDWSEEVKKAASVSIAQTDGIYSDARAYLQHLQVSYKPVVYQFKVRAQKKVSEAKKLTEQVTKASVKEVYERSRSTVGKASKNARKISRRPVAFSRQIYKKYIKYHKNVRDSKLRE